MPPKVYTHFYHQREGVPADTIVHCPRCNNRLIADMIMALDTTLTPPQLIAARRRWNMKRTSGKYKDPPYVCNGCFENLFVQDGNEPPIVTRADWLRQMGADQADIDKASRDKYWPGE